METMTRGLARLVTVECGGIVYQMQQISVGELGSQRGSKGPLVCVWGSRDGFISQYAQKHLHINIPKEKNKQKSEKRETKFNKIKFLLICCRNGSN